MKNIIKIVILLLTLTLLTACTSRVPFHAKKPILDSALVYIYLPATLSNDDETSSDIYTIYINDKIVKGALESNEYRAFDMKVNSTTFSIVRGAIERKSITLDLKEGNIYYLKIENGLENNDFNLLLVNKIQGLKEISKTGLSGSVAVNQNTLITEVIESKETQKISKIDEIEKAYKLKEKGILSQAEFEKLKTEILVK